MLTVSIGCSREGCCCSFPRPWRTADFNPCNSWMMPLLAKCLRLCAKQLCRHSCCKQSGTHSMNAHLTIEGVHSSWARLRPREAPAPLLRCRQLQMLLRFRAIALQVGGTGLHARYARPALCCSKRLMQLCRIAGMLQCCWPKTCTWLCCPGASKPSDRAHHSPAQWQVSGAAQMECSHAIVPCLRAA